MKKLLTTFLLLVLGLGRLCATTPDSLLVMGDERIMDYLHLMQGKRVGVLADYNSRIDNRHLVDTLMAVGADVQLIFAPEDGFRGDGVVRQRDTYMGIEVVTLLDRPRTNDVFKCDMVLCDLSDVGTRNSSPLRALVRLMNVCADIDVPLVVLDRPNPYGRCVDGAIVEPRYRTSEDELPLPLMYGMTLGEMARMINGEGWLRGGAKCPLTVVPCLWTPVLDENVPATTEENTTPVATIYSEGLVENVPIVVTDGEGGVDLTSVVALYTMSNVAPENFFVGDMFDRQMGVSYVRDMIVLGYSAEEIESVWRGDVGQFLAQREPYLLY